MGFFARLFDGDAPQASPVNSAAPADSIPALVDRAAEVVLLINQNSDVLPTLAVVLARRVTDALAAILARGDVTNLGPNALITLRGVITSYLPDTIGTYVAAARAGHADDVALMQQLTALHQSVVAVLGAAREGDAQAMEVQHMFLVTKFTASDLDL